MPSTSSTPDSFPFVPALIETIPAHPAIIKKTMVKMRPIGNRGIDVHRSRGAAVLRPYAVRHMMDLSTLRPYAVRHTMDLSTPRPYAVRQPTLVSPTSL